MRLRSPRVISILTLLAITACGAAGSGGSASNTNPSPPSTIGLANGGCTIHTFLPFQPTFAHEGDVPASGSYRSVNGPVPLNHTPVMCYQSFTEIVDFTQLGDWPSCKDDPTAPVDQRRPCYEGFRAHPDQRSDLLNSLPNGPKLGPDGKPLWRPREGQALKVVCQTTGNQDPAQGSEQNVQRQRSNVWNKIRDPRIEKGGVGWINDIWMGAVGFRGFACPTPDAFWR